MPYFSPLGHKVLAIEIFGFNGWSHEVRSCAVDFVDASGGRFCVSVAALVRVSREITRISALSIIIRGFFVRNPFHYVLMKCGTRQFWRFENEFWHFENEFHDFENEFHDFGNNF